MPATPNGPGHADWLVIEGYVEAFESARANDPEADFERFLPEADDPLREAVLCELIRVDLEHGWERGSPKGLDHYRERFPALFRDPARAKEIAYEEFRLRRRAGEAPTPNEYRQRLGVPRDDWPSAAFGPPPAGDGAIVAPHPGATAMARHPLSLAATAFRARRGDDTLGFAWRDNPDDVLPELLDLFDDLQRDDPGAADRLADAAAALPEIGGRFLGFRLEAELGRGAFGRVFLARQGDLADRLVALKVSADVSGESCALAQLQHTNIVPVYSVHRRGTLQAVCMPYLGSATLADVLADIRRHGTMPGSGRALLSTLDERRSRLAGSSLAIEGGEPQKHDEPPAAQPEPTPTQVRKFGSLSYVEAVLWLACRLADGLAHAHERGILHQDIKPANVLFADDGEPLLLDFNLADDTKLRVHASAALVGGTLPYMAPEHLEAFRDNRPRPDPRSDLFALGVILFELLTGHPPYPERRGRASAILPEMIADRRQPPPQLRPLNPAVSPAVESIVRKCLEPEPDRRYDSARDLHEDLSRHLDDLPLKHASEPSVRERIGKWARRHPRLTSSTTVALLGVALVAATAAGFLVRQRHLVRLEAGASFRRFHDEELPQVQTLLARPDAPPEEVAAGLDLARSALGRYGVPDSSEHFIDSSLVQSLPPVDRTLLRADLGELILLMARDAIDRAEKATEPERRREALNLADNWLWFATIAFGEEPAPRAYWLQRAELARLQGHSDEADTLETRASTAPLETEAGIYLAMADRFDRRRFDEVLAHYQKAVRQTPRSAENWILLGHAHAALDQLDSAMECYRVASALRPDRPWVHFNRGLIALDRRDFHQALAEFDEFVADRPIASGYLNRALARMGLGDAEGAVADLNRVLADPDAPTRALFVRADALARLGRAEEAARDRDEGLRRAPEDPASWVSRGIARLRTRDPKGALDDFAAALELDPTYRPALQNRAAVLSESLHRPEEAVRVFDRLIPLHPGSVMAWNGRGILLARLGRRDEAIRDARKSLELANDPETLYRASNILAQTSKSHPEDRPEALRLFAEAARRDRTWLKIVAADPDMDPIRDLPEFQKLAHALQLVHGEDGL